MVDYGRLIEVSLLGSSLMMAEQEFQFYSTSELLNVKPPQTPAGFEEFWQWRYSRALQVHPRPGIRHTGRQRNGFELYDLSYQSTDGVEIHGWLTLPNAHCVKRVMVVGHGYGGCPEPGDAVPLVDAAYLWPCLRGLGRSKIEGIPEDPYYHVLYDIDKPDRYILGGCVEDVWLAVSAAEKLFPAAKNRLALMGISFGGGIGALAAAWDDRIRAAHFEVPTFGHQKLRLSLPSWGSARAVQDFSRKHPEVAETLALYDAASAAAFIQVPVHIAAALYDPLVTPPGQFAIYNALTSQRDLFVLEQGHSEYANAEKDQKDLLEQLKSFFANL